MYEINYIDQQFFIITKPQDKNSLNWPVGSGHSRLGLQIYFLSWKSWAHWATGMEEGLGGYANKMGSIYIAHFIDSRIIRRMMCE